MIEMDRHSLAYSLVLTGQHKETMSDLIKDFGLKEPDHYLVGIREASTSIRLISWLQEIAQKTLRDLKNEPWLRQAKLCMVHGDTLSTLIGAMIAKRFNIPVAHIEAGLRSYNYLNPFPEELIRVAVSRLSSFDYAPGKWAMGNLNCAGRKNKEIINTVENTLLDSIRFALKHQIHKQYGMQPTIWGCFDS